MQLSRLEHSTLGDLHNVSRRYNCYTKVSLYIYKYNYIIYLSDLATSQKKNWTVPGWHRCQSRLPLPSPRCRPTSPILAGSRCFPYKERPAAAVGGAGYRGHPAGLSTPNTSHSPPRTAARGVVMGPHGHPLAAAGSGLQHPISALRAIARSSRGR
jgi:hypothetical protein